MCVNPIPFLCTVVWLASLSGIIPALANPTPPWVILANHCADGIQYAICGQNLDFAVGGVSSGEECKVFLGIFTRVEW